MQLHLYHLKNSRSQRIIWLLEELQAEYLLHFSDNAQTEGFSDTTIPLKFPTLAFKSNEFEYVLTETSAIADFLVSRFEDTLSIPSETQLAFIDYVFWKNYADASLMPNVALKQVFAQIKQNTPYLLKPVSWAFQQGFNKAYLDRELDGQLTRINTHLKDKEWIAGSSFTTADILIWFPLEACMRFTLNMDKFNHINRYMAQIHNRPHFKTSMSKGKWSNESFDCYWSI